MKILCPNCKKHTLEWEMVGGVIRVYREVDGKRVYKARCADCGDLDLNKRQAGA